MKTLLVLSVIVVILSLAHCATICYLKNADDPTVCSGHGQCIATNNCQCSRFYSGLVCGVPCFLFGFSLSIEGGSIVTMLTSDYLRLSAALTLPDCLKNEQLIYRWSLTTPSLNITSDKPYFEVEPFTFPNDGFLNSYTVNLQVAVANDTSIVRTASSVLFVASVRPVASVVGGNIRLVPSGSQIDLDGRRSYFPGVTSFNCSWRCKSGCAVEDYGSSCLLTFGPIAAGTYTLDFTVSAYNLTDTTTLIIIASPSILVIPVITLGIGRCQMSTTRIRARGSLLSIDRSLSYRWRLLQAGTDIELNSARIATRTNTMRDLVFRENALPPATAYELKFEVLRNGTVLSYASANLRTCDIPSGGSVTVQPSTGRSMATRFTLVAPSWTASGASLPLSFAFQYRNRRGKWMWLSFFSPLNSLVTFLPQGTDANDNLLIRSVARTRFGAVQYSNPISVTCTEIELPTNPLQAIILNLELFSNGFTEAAVGMISSVLDRYNTTESQSLNAVITFKKKLADTIGALVTQGKFEFKSGLASMASLFSGAMDRETKMYGFGMMEQILARADIDHETIIQSLDPIINLVKSVEDEPDDKKYAFDLLQNLGQSMLTTLATGEEPIMIEEESFCMCAQAEEPAALQNVMPMGVANSSMMFSLADHPQLEGLERVGFIFASSERINPYANDTRNTASSFIAFKVVDEDGNHIPLRNMSTPLMIGLSKLNQTVFDATQNYTIQCMYWDETNDSQTEWLSDGCTLVSEDDSVIHCSCTHTTTFAAFIQYPDQINNTKLEVALYGTSIAVHSTIVTIAIPMLIISFLFRKHQPMKSRFISPYMGLIAVIIESLIQGIIRSAMLIGLSNGNAINWVGNAVLVITNPFSLLAWFMFFWQHLRYCFVQHMYEAMKKNEKAAIFTFRILSSKILYVVLCVLIWVVSFGYFFLFAGLRQGNVINYTDGTTIGVASYSGMSLIFSIGIILSFTWDALNYIRLERKRIKSMQDGEGNDGKKKGISFTEIIAALKKFFNESDPYKFRSEALLMITTVLLSSVSYITGLVVIRSVNGDYDPAKIVQFVFDILYLISRISAFGAFAGFVTARSYIKMGGNLLSINKKSTADNTPEIEALLQDKQGYELMFDYAASELALENIYAWSDLQVHKERLCSSNTATVKESMSYMCQMYIQRNSSRELNLSHKTKTSLLKMNADLEQGQYSEADLKDCVSKLEIAVFTNLSDTYSRLCCTEEYRRYIKHQEMNKELLVASHLE